MELLLPWLMPESTTSGWRGQKYSTASFTQSTGVPSQQYTLSPSACFTSRTRSGRDEVMLWLRPEALYSGAITTTSPNSMATSSRARNPLAATPSSLVINISGFIRA